MIGHGLTLTAAWPGARRARLRDRDAAAGQEAVLKSITTSRGHSNCEQFLSQLSALVLLLQSSRAAGRWLDTTTRAERAASRNVVDECADITTLGRFVLAYL